METVMQKKVQGLAEVAKTLNNLFGNHLCRLNLKDGAVNFPKRDYSFSEAIVGTNNSLVLRFLMCDDSELGDLTPSVHAVEMIFLNCDHVIIHEPGSDDVSVDFYSINWHKYHTAPGYEAPIHGFQTERARRLLAPIHVGKLTYM